MLKRKCQFISVGKLLLPLLGILSLLLLLYVRGEEEVSVHPRPQFVLSTDHIPSNQSSRPSYAKSTATVMMKNDNSIRNVLVLSTNPRSGSSYLSEVLASSSAEANGSYFFEPLRWIKEIPPKNVVRPRKKARDEVKKKKSLQDISTNATSEEKWSMIKDFFNCNFERHKDIVLSNYARANVFRNPSSSGLGAKKSTGKMMTESEVLPRLMRDCKESKLRVLKTIRLRGDDLQSSSAAADTFFSDFHNFKILLLVRDPRAVVNSILQSPYPWDSKMRDFRNVCKNILETVGAVRENKILSSRTLAVKYEDLVTNSEEEWKRIADFLGLSNMLSTIMRNVGARIENQRRGLPRSKSRHVQFDGFHYYRTSRSSNFTHDLWRELLPASSLAEFQTVAECQEVSRMLDGGDESIIPPLNPDDDR